MATASKNRLRRSCSVPAVPTNSRMFWPEHRDGPKRAFSAFSTVNAPFSKVSLTLASAARTADSCSSLSTLAMRLSNSAIRAAISGEVPSPFGVFSVRTNMSPSAERACPSDLRCPLNSCERTRRSGSLSPPNNQLPHQPPRRSRRRLRCRLREDRANLVRRPWRSCQPWPAGCRPAARSGSRHRQARGPGCRLQCCPVSCRWSQSAAESDQCARTAQDVADDALY